MHKINEYEISAIIYESKNSIVYRGWQNKEQQPVILKILKSDSTNPSEINRYKQEYEIIVQLKLEGVVRAYALEKYQSTLAIVLEDFGGESLKKLMKGQKFKLEEMVKIASKVADTLGDIHTANIIHKDINPSNIVYNPKTKQVKIIDFGIATILPRENPNLSHPNILEGTLAYISPEQTGRMNRSIDYRTDFYSLGVTLYELLTHQLPFATTDTMELIHCHIAKKAVPPHEINGEIPKIISDIVMKLLAKNAEDRYQSAYGLKADLDSCLRQLQTSGNISGFPISRQDISDKFQIPQKLYGRERELANLLAAFERVVASAVDGAQTTYILSKSETILVSGYSGIGKSTLVQEIYKPITRQRGYFIAGKFDQVQQNSAYSALIEAFQELIRQVLTESEAQIKNWRSQILTALGDNAQIIIDAIPEVELIIGKQDPLPKLASAESQNRFHLVLQNLIKVFAKPAHPLAIFIEDLQWADAASLEFIQQLMTDQDSQSLLLIGSYRENEVSPDHPLMLTLSEMKERGAIVNRIYLSNLKLNQVNQLIADTLKSNPEQTKPLAKLVLDKTHGNPFFINEFLNYLYLEKLIKFDYQKGNWQWNLEQIKAVPITDNVVGLMVKRIKKLPKTTIWLLQIAACIGNQFELKTLSIVNEKSEKETANELWSAIQAGLILPIGDDYKFLQVAGASDRLKITYKFAHARVQQSAYSLIPENTKKALHLRIGQLMIEQTEQLALEDKLFDIVERLNLSRELITTEAEREHLTQLNLMAAKKAKASIAYEPALKYLKIGLELLPKDCWLSCYRLAFEVQINYAEVLSVTKHFSQGKKVFQLIFTKIDNDLDRAKCHEKYSEILHILGKPAAAFQEASKGLAIFGIKLVKAEAESLIAEAIQGETIKRFETLKLAAERDSLIGRLYDKAIISTHFSQPDRLNLVVSKNLKHILDFGLTPQSGNAIAWFATILAMMERKQLSFRYAELAINIAERFNDSYFSGATKVLAYGFSLCCKHSFTQNDKLLQDAFLLCHNTGNLQFASYALLCKYIGILTQSTDCKEVLESCKQWHDYCEKYVPLELGKAKIRLHCISQLIDSEPTQIDIEQILHDYTNAKDYIDVCESLIEIARIETLFGNYKAGYETCKRAEPMLLAGAVKSLLLQVTFYHFYSICCARLYGSESQEELKQEYLDQLQSNLKKSSLWLELNTDIFYSYYVLIKAELARAQADREKAIFYYLRTINHAKKNSYTLLQAVANEFLAELYVIEQHRFAKGRFEEAHCLYLQCGAKAKAKTLSAKFPQIFRRESESLAFLNPSTTITFSAATTDRYFGTLDLASAIKASQAVSGEIALDKLLTSLMKISLENAGAQKGVLILYHSGTMMVEAAGSIDTETIEVLQSIPVDSGYNLPLTIINYVLRTKYNVVLSHASKEGIFTQDPYILKNKIKSVLATPIINQGETIGIFYLENNLTSDAFTPDRLEILKILSSQAAISIKNALLYQTLEQKVKERTAQLEQANAEISALNNRLRAENIRLSTELEVARKLQQMILPKEAELEQIPELEIAGFSEPAAEVGGDYYDIMPQSDRIKIGIGDVTGHGLESGVLAIMVQTAVRTLLANNETDPVQFLNVLNRTIYDNLQRMNCDKNLTFALIDYQDGRLRLSGQHEQLIVVRSSGSVELIDTIDLGFPLGIVSDIADFVAYADIQLNSGDVVVLYTDGITEAEDINGVQYGLDRLCKVTSRNRHCSAADIRQAAIADLRQHIGNQTVYDDITLLVFKQK